MQHEKEVALLSVSKSRGVVFSSCRSAESLLRAGCGVLEVMVRSVSRASPLCVVRPTSFRGR